MDELEWLRDRSPSTRPSREVTRRHRTQLRGAIAAEGADGTRPRRPRRQRRTRHRVLLTGTAVVAVIAIGAGVVAVTSSGGDDDASTVGAPAPSPAPTSSAPAATCPGPPPKELAIPAGFGNPVAGPAKDTTSEPAPTQRVASWSNGRVTIEQRWPADRDAAEKFGAIASQTSDGSFTGSGDLSSTIDERGVAHRTSVFTFGGQAPGCAHVQISVSGTDVAAVDELAERLSTTPFGSKEPLVATTAAALSAPPVVACPGADKAAGMERPPPFVATVGGPVTLAPFARPTDALADFLAGRNALFPRGYHDLRLADSSIVYAKELHGKVVTTVHVVPVKDGWTVADWQASGC